MSTFSDLSMHSELIIQQEISQTKKAITSKYKFTVSSGDTAQGAHPAWESGRCSSLTPCSVRAATGARVYFLLPQHGVWHLACSPWTHK